MCSLKTVTYVALAWLLATTKIGVALECDPKPTAGELANLAESRDSVGLAKHLFDTANLSGDFKAAHGEDRVKAAIDGLVSKYFEGRKAKDPKPSGVDAGETAASFREGILAACEAVKDGKSEEKVKKQALRAANLSGGDSEFVVLLGTVNSLEGDGNFSSGLEASFQSTTDFEAAKLPGIGRLGVYQGTERIITGTFEITFSEIGSIDDEEQTGMSAMSAASQNPFAAGGGFFRLNTSADFYFADKGARGLGVRVGGGFSTQPSDSSDDDVDTRGRGYAGLVFRANYGVDEHGREGKGEVFLGLAKDKFWKFDRVVDDSVMPVVTERVDEAERIIVDARMDIPQVFESEDVRLHARLFADLPASGDGPSDIRISLLLTVNLGAFFPVN